VQLFGDLQESSTRGGLMDEVEIINKGKGRAMQSLDDIAGSMETGGHTSRLIMNEDGTYLEISNTCYEEGFTMTEEERKTTESQESDQPVNHCVSDINNYSFYSNSVPSIIDV
jgi:hypothetical protein